VESPGFGDTTAARRVCRFELLGTGPTEMTVSARSLEGIDMRGHLGGRQLSVLVDPSAIPMQRAEVGFAHELSDAMFGARLAGFA
jgi:hypothetical protein